MEELTGTDHYLVVAKVRETVSKQASNAEVWYGEKLSETEGKEWSQIKIWNKFTALEILGGSYSGDVVNINRA